MRYNSTDMEWVRYNFLSFWAIFGPFTPLLTPKIKIWKNVKTLCRYYPLHMYHKWRSYDVWFLRYKEQRAIFCPLTGFELTKKKVYYSFITQEEQAKACRMHKNFGVFAMQNKVFERRFWQHIKSVLCWFS